MFTYNSEYTRARVHRLVCLLQLLSPCKYLQSSNGMHRILLPALLIHAKILIPYTFYQLQVYDAEGNFRMSYGRKGEKDGELQRPTGIAVDQKGRLIVADRDNHRIQVFGPSGEFLLKFGSKGEREGELNDPHGLAVLSDGRIAEADFRNNRLQLFTI